MLSLSQLHIEQERYDEAEVLLQEALSIAREKMGPEQRSTLNLMNAYAVLHTKKGQYDQAEKLFNEVLKGRQQELGDDHPKTLESLKSLIDLYEAWNKPEKAKKWRLKLPQTEAVEQ